MEDSVVELERLLAIDDEDARYESAFHLARHDGRAADWARGWFDSPDNRCREVAQIVLGRVCPQEGAATLPDLCVEVIPLIERALTDSSPDVRAYAVYGLGHHRHPETIPTILSAFTCDPDADVRAAAIWALGKQTHYESIPLIVSAIDDPSEEVRYKAALSLGCFYDFDWDESTLHFKPTLTEALLKLMDDVDNDVRDWATFAIHQCGHDTPETRARLWKALDDTDYNVRGEAAEALAIFGDRTILPRLKTLLEDEDELSPCFFIAADSLGATELLPAMKAAAVRWIAWADDSGNAHSRIIDEAIESLEAKATHVETITDFQEN